MSMTIRVNQVGTVDSIELALTAVVERGIEGINTSFKDALGGAAMAAVDAVKTASPYRQGSGPMHYRSGWRYRVTEEDMAYSAVVFNRNKPSLTWLLQNGHRLMRGKRGTPMQRQVGYVRGIPHIDKGYEAASAYLKSRGW